LIDIPALNQQEQDGVRRPVRYGTRKPKKQQQQQQQDQEEMKHPEGSTDDQGKTFFSVDIFRYFLFLSEGCCLCT